MTKEYKEIEVKQTAPEAESIIEVELTDVTKEPNTQEEEKKPKPEAKEENPSEDDSKNKQEAKKEEEGKKKKTYTPKKPSRAQKRIKQLHSEKSELELELEKERKARFDLEKQVKSGSKSSKEALRDSLISSSTTLTKALQDAMEDGNSTEAVRLQDELMNNKMQLAGLTAELNQIESQADEKQEYVPKQAKQQVPDISDKALDWIDEYPQFKTDPLFHVAAVTIDKLLVNEGFDRDSDEFYTELTTRMTPRFPEVFGTAEENSVEYKNKQASEEELTDENKNSSTQNDDSSSKGIEQTVSSSSRAAPHQGGKRGSGTSEKVKLSPADVERAERWGFTLEQMARRVAHNTKNRDNNGYVPISIDKK